MRTRPIIHKNPPKARVGSAGRGNRCLGAFKCWLPAKFHVLSIHVRTAAVGQAILCHRCAPAEIGHADYVAHRPIVDGRYTAAEVADVLEPGDQIGLDL